MKCLAMCTLILACAAAGCTSARAPRYYTISMPHTDRPVGEPKYPVTIVVGRLNAPHILRDDRVVYSLSDVELGVDEYHRWAEPPTGMIERLLVQRLRSTGEYRSAQHLSSSTRGDYILRGYLGALNEVDDSAGVKARFALQVELFDEKAGRVVWNESYSHEEPVGQKNVKSVVESLQKAVNAGVDQLCGDLSQYFAAHPTT